MPRHGRSFPFRARFRRRTFKGLIGVTASAAILLDATGAGASIAAAVGTAAISWGASGAGASTAAAAGTAPLVVTATATSAATGAGAGTAAIVFSATGTATATTSAAGTAAILVGATGTSAATAASAATASVTVTATGVGASSGGSTGLTRVQGTPRTRALGTLSVAITFATPPTIGNAIVVPVLLYNSSSLITPTCADNRGNTYTLAAVQGNGFIGSAIFVCSKVATATAPFTVTVTQPTASYFEASAIEVGGAVGPGLVVDRTATQAATTATPTTGTTAALTHDDVFLVSAMAVGANQAAITVESVTPAWLQEFENLDHSTSIAGETDSRPRSGALGTTQSCSWTVSTGLNTAAVLAAFAAMAPPVTGAGTAAITVGATAVGATAEPVVLLVGAESALLDESTYHRTLTVVGNAARTTAQAKYGTAAITFDGVGDWIQMPAVAELQFQTGDFTVEAWVRFTTKTNNQAIFGQWGAGGNSWYLYIQSGLLTFTHGTPLGPVFVPTLGRWYHIAVDRSGTTLRLYVDGAVVMSTTSMTTFPPSTDPIVLGAIGTASAFAAYDLNGQLDEVRFTKGLAQYAGAFTPPTGPFPRPGVVTAAAGVAALAFGATGSGVAPLSAAGTAAITVGATGVGAIGSVIGAGAGTATIVFGAAGSSVLPAPLRATQLVAELVIPLARSPIVATHVAAELMLALGPQPNEARVTQLVCELLVLRVPVPPCTSGAFPVDDAGLGTACAVPVEPLPPAEPPVSAVGTAALLVRRLHDLVVVPIP